MSDAKSTTTKSTEKSTDKSSDAKSLDKSSESSSSTGDTKADTGGKASKKGGKSEASARESVGGTSEVHYGYFSNVRNDNYRSGWDDIWNAKPRKPRRNTRKKK